MENTAMPPPLAADRRLPYRAFISYNHDADGNLAPALRDALQVFARRWYRVHAIKVFHDRSSLSASHGLWSMVERALSGSEYFLFKSATSQTTGDRV
jgi:hypothetical protein